MGKLRVFLAIRRPFTNFAKLFLGAILLFLPVINLFTTGFIFNCIKSDKELPKWRLGMFIDGLTVFFIVILYSIPLWILFAVLYLFDFSAYSVLIIPFYILAFLTAYVIPSALVIFAKKNVFCKGVLGFAFSKEYFLAFVIGALWAVGLNCISLLLVRILYWMLPLSLFAILIMIVAMMFLLASQITFLTLIANAYE